MKKITLRFPTGNDLYEFRQRADVKQAIMDFSSNSLVAICSETEIELAVNTYGAKVIHTKDENQEANH